MSTRYIWGKYTNEIRYYESINTGVNNSAWNVNGDVSFSTSRDRLIGFVDKPVLNRTTGKYSVTTQYSKIGTTYNSIDTDTYNYALYVTYGSSRYSGPSISSSASHNDDTGSFTFSVDNWGKIVDSDDVLRLFSRGYTNTDWEMDNGFGQMNGVFVGTYSSGGDAYRCDQYDVEKGNYPDEFQNYVSSRTSSSYPSFDLDSDGYFYYAEDQDIIDPSSVNLPESIRYNSDITISITPSSDAQTNSYGNIIYTYQYRFNDGSWTTIETTSETSVELHIPSGKSSIQARVLAQDDIGFTSSTYVASATVNIYASDPPSAPSSISVDRVVEGWTSKITIGEATDTDGTITTYVFERKTQNGNWTEVQRSSELTFTDNPDGGWGTVQYRAYAIDNSNTPGPYMTSIVYTVLTDVIVIVGPTRKDFGTKLADFNLSFYVIIAGDASATGIAISVQLDSSTNVYSGNVNTEEMVTTTVPITGLSETSHTITITASKGGYTTANETYTFTIEGLTLPEGGNAVQFQDSTAKPVVPITRAEAVLFSDGRTLAEVIASLMG